MTTENDSGEGGHTAPAPPKHVTELRGVLNVQQNKNEYYYKCICGAMGGLTDFHAVATHEGLQHEKDLNNPYLIKERF